jgi:methionine synthase II (cobalamin-independent)
VAFRDALYPAYTRALGAEIERMLTEIPAEELAIQWDIPGEVSIAEGVPNGGSWTIDDAAKQLGAMAALVPDAAELGFHHCYGDPPDAATGHGKHWLEPTDAGAMVRLTNAFVKHVDRKIDWVHMPVPIGRSDDEYFAPLADLKLPTETELYLGLVHYEDGVHGTQKRIDAAAKYVKGFGVATECGLGRIPREEVVPTMHIHRELTVPPDTGGSDK